MWAGCTSLGMYVVLLWLNGHALQDADKESQENGAVAQPVRISKRR